MMLPTQSRARASGQSRAPRRGRVIPFVHGLLAFVLVLAAAGCARGPLRFAWLTDTHVGAERAADDLRALVADINSIEGLRFVLVTGDVTEMGTFEELRQAKGILDGLRLPYHIIPGNHDTKWSESGATDFGRLLGSDRFDFVSGGFRFIGLAQGPIMRMGDGHFAPQDVRWLDERLSVKRGGAKRLVFVTHYPLDPSVANWFVVLDKLKAAAADAVLVGHGHRNRAMDFEGLPGVMGRAAVGTKDVAPGCTIVEARGGSLIFAERTGGRTLPPWNEMTLGGRTMGAAEARPARPDFGVNGAFPRVRVRWRFETGWTITSSAALAEGLVVVGDASGKARALRVSDGGVAWEVATEGPVHSTPDAASGRVVLASTDGTVRALEAATGRTLWVVRPRSGRREGRSAIVACPRIDAHAVYIGTSNGEFLALRLADGRSLWTFRGIEGFVETRPLIAEGKVVFGAWDGRLYALGRETGELAWAWRGDRPSRLYAPAACWPVAAGGRVFIVAPDRRMTAIDLSTGREIWRTDRWAVRESLGLSEDGGRAYVRTMEGLIVAVSTSGDGPEAVWETDAGLGYDINPAQLAERDGVVFYGTKNGLLVALDALTGTLRWKHRVGIALLNTVTPLSGSEVAVTDADGRISLVVEDR